MRPGKDQDSSLDDKTKGELKRIAKLHSHSLGSGRLVTFVSGVVLVPPCS